MKFVCKMCGNCCKNMRGRIGERPLPHMPPFVFMAVPPSLATIGLYEWEVPILKEKAKQLSLNFKTKPAFVFWDEISNVAIVTSWNLDHDDCPFLSNENRCRIHEQKPLICQAYPLVAFGILFSDREKPKELGLADCPNAVPLPYTNGLLKIRTRALYKKLFQLYGSSFLGVLRLDAAINLFRETLKYLREEELIRPAILKKNIIKALLRSKPLGLLEYLRNKHPDIEQELRKGINSIYEYSITNLEQLMQDARHI